MGGRKKAVAEGHARFFWGAGRGGESRECVRVRSENKRSEREVLFCFLLVSLVLVVVSRTTN